MTRYTVIPALDAGISLYIDCRVKPDNDMRDKIAVSPPGNDKLKLVNSNYSTTAMMSEFLTIK